MNIAPDWTLAIQIVNFGILFGVLRWKLFGPLMNILEEREKKIKSDIENAELSREEAIKLKKDYEDKLKEAAKEAQGIIQNAALEGEKLKKELIEKGKDEVGRLKKQGELQIDIEKEKASLELRQQVAGLSVKIASKLLQRNIDEEANSVIISEFIGDMNS